MKATVFSDSQFPAAEWEEEVIRYASRKHLHVENVQKSIDVMGRTSPAEGSSIKGRTRQTTITAQRGPGDDPQKQIAATLLHLNRKAVFDPSQLGKVESIDFYLDLMSVDATPGIEVHYAIALLQDGVLFQSPPARLTGNKKWKGFISESLVAADFVRITRNTPVLPQTRPNFSKQAPAMQFGYIVHAASPGASFKSVTAIGEWKVSVAHREDLQFSLSQTQEYKMKLESEVLERQRLERAIVEQRLKAEQELRQTRLQADEELRRCRETIDSLRMSLPVAPSSEKRTSSFGDDSRQQLGRTEDLGRLLGSSGISSDQYVDDKYISIVKAAQSRLQEVDSRRKAERERKEKLAEERDNMQKTIELERQKRDELERNMNSMLQEVTNSAAEEKRQLSEELASYRKRIFNLEQELRTESKAKEQKEEELRTALQRAEELQKRFAQMTAEMEELTKLLQQQLHEASFNEQHLKKQVEDLNNTLEGLVADIAALESEKRHLEEKLLNSCAQLEKREREIEETLAAQEQKMHTALLEAEDRLRAEIEKWQNVVQRRKVKYGERQEALKLQLAEEKNAIESELKKVVETHERKEEAWKRTAKELKNKYKVCVQQLSAANEESERKEQELQQSISALQQQLDEASKAEAQQADLNENQSKAIADLQAELTGLKAELEALHSELQTKEETWEQARWQAELEHSETKRNAQEEIERVVEESQVALLQERKKCDLLEESLRSTQDQLSSVLAEKDTLEATVERLMRELQARDLAEREKASYAAQLEARVADEERARAELETSLRSAEEATEGLHARLDTEVKRSQALQQALTAVTAENEALKERVSTENAASKSLDKEFKALKENYEVEKSLREKIAMELFAEIDARKEGEKRQAAIISALNEHMKKQAEAIVQLDFALKQEQADRAELESQLEEAVLARVKAEEALRKLDEIFKHASKEDDAEWELVDDKQSQH